MEFNSAKIQELCRQLLIEIGEDPDRPGLKETPRRWAAFWEEFSQYQDGNISTTFEVAQTDQMVVIRDIRVWSLCEHHLLPFWIDLTLGYIATDRILGLSKFARIAHRRASRLQVQERLVHEIADDITLITTSQNVAVVGRGVHTCMVMRGIKTSGVMSTSVMRGLFRDDPKARSEFFELARAL